jgi:EmrB/QacA subfamily drug resistance transporter
MKRKDLALCLLVASVSFIELLDTTILNTAIPKIASSLQVDVLTLKLAVTGYLVALAIFIPISGWVAERYGTRNTLVSAILLFTFGSLGCGMSHTLGQLVLFRILQGAGAALMTPVARLTYLQLVPRTELMRVAGLVAIPIVVGPLLGPLLGGYITTYYSWSWVFFINLPVGLLAALLIGLLLSNQKSKETRPFDVPGFFLAAMGLGLLNVTLESLDNPALSRGLLAAMAIMGLAGVILLVYRSLRIEHPVLEFRLVRNPSLRHGLWMAFLGFSFAGSVPLVAAILLQVSFGMTPFESGLTTCWAAVASVVTKPLIRPLLSRFGPRRVATVYPIVFGLVLVFLGTVGHATPKVLLSVAFVAWGLAMSIHMSIVAVVPYSDLSSDAEAAKATSLFSTVQQVSMSFGVSLGVILLDELLEQRGISVLTSESPREATMSCFHWTFLLLASLTPLLAVANARFRDWKLGEASRTSEHFGH